MASGWWWLTPIAAGLGVEAAIMIRRRQATAPIDTRHLNPTKLSTVPGPSGSASPATSVSGGSSGSSASTSTKTSSAAVASNPCDPMTMFCLLHYPVGGLPVPDAVGWIPAQRAADMVYYSGHTLFELLHHPVGYYGSSLIAAQQAADYLLEIGIDPCPPDLYADLNAASQQTGVPLPLLLGVAYTESTFLKYGTVANVSVVSPYGDYGLMQVGESAVAQIDQTFQLGLTFAEVQSSPASNALAGAYYLRYLAQEAGLAYTSTDYAAWTPLLASGYGEGTAATTSTGNAASSTWQGQQSPATTAVAQAKRLTTVVKVPAAIKPATVNCQDVRMTDPTTRAIVTVKVCSDATWTIEK